MSSSRSLDPGTSAPVPDRTHARLLVAILGTFWASFAVAAAFTDARSTPAGSAVFGSLGVVALFAFYAALFDVWSPISGVPGWRLALGFAPLRLRARVMTCLLRPQWVRACLRATDWPMGALGMGLGFCCLEFIGAPLLIATLVIGRYAANHSSADLTLPYLEFGLGFAGSVAFFAVRTSGIFNGTVGSGSVYWFGFWFLVGCSIMGVGVVSLIRRLDSDAAPKGRPSAG